MRYNEKLDAALAALKGDMVEALQRWVRVPSVRAEREARRMRRLARTFAVRWIPRWRI